MPKRLVDCVVRAILQFKNLLVVVHAVVLPLATRGWSWWWVGVVVRREEGVWYLILPRPSSEHTQTLITVLTRMLSPFLSFQFSLYLTVK
jgi:hypothetical protein